MKCLRYICAIACFGVFSSVLAQQTAAVRGRVYDSAGKEAIVGASVSIPGISSALTDNDGFFQLKKSIPDAMLYVNAEGYALKVLPVKEGEMLVYLYEENYPNAVRSVDLPFGESSDLSSPYALSIYDATGFKKRGVVSAEDLLVGGNGLNAISRSGMPGSGSNLYLRGFNSLNANVQPLIVIDGMPIDNASYGTSVIEGSVSTPLSYMDAKDIESITVLKDGTALFGSRGANGVILINTLEAEQMATQINFYAYAGLNFEPSNQMRMMKSKEYRSYLSEMLQNSGRYTQSEIDNMPIFNREKPYQEIWGWEGNTDYYRYNQETDWQDQLFRNSLNQNYYIDIKGGDEVAVFALSLGFLKHNGIVSNTDFSRYTARFNSRFNMGKRVVLHSNMGFVYGEKTLKDEGLVSTAPMLISLRKAPFMTAYVYDQENAQSRTLEEADMLGVSNPYSALNHTDIRAKKYRFDANLRPQILLSKDWSVNGQFGLMTDKLTEQTFYPMAGMSYEDHRLGAVENKMARRSLRFLQLYGDIHVKFNKKMGTAHHLLAAAGVRYQNNAIEEDWSKGYNSPTDDMKSVGSGDPDYEQTGGLLNNWRWMSYYLHADYSFKDRYALTFSTSLDGSSNYGKDAPGLVRMYNTPFASFSSLTASWLLSSEDFMSGQDFVNRLKLRASIGTSGNDGVTSAYSVLKYYESVAFLGQQGVVRGNIPNTQLQWETALKKNVGVDVSVWNERINLNVDFYHNLTKDLLCYKTLLSETGAGITRYLTNDGTLSNKGFEVALQARIINSDFKWDLGLQVSKYQNELISYADGRNITSYAGGSILTAEKHPIGLFYGYQTEDNVVFATQAEADAANLTTVASNGQTIKFAAGDVHFKDLYQDGVIDEKDRSIIGDPNPDFFGAITTALQWKRWKLSALFTYSLGNDVYNALRYQLESMNGTFNQTQAVKNRWRYENYRTNVPKAVWGDPAGNARFSDRWIEDGSYLKWKTMTLSYQVPVRGDIPILRGLEVYATGNNLYTLTRYLGYDPEFNASQNPLYYGIDMGMTPLSPSVLLGVRIAL